MGAGLRWIGLHQWVVPVDAGAQLWEVREGSRLRELEVEAEAVPTAEVSGEGVLGDDEGEDDGVRGGLGQPEPDEFAHLLLVSGMKPIMQALILHAC